MHKPPDQERNKQTTRLSSNYNHCVHQYEAHGVSLELLVPRASVFTGQAAENRRYDTVADQHFGPYLGGRNETRLTKAFSLKLVIYNKEYQNSCGALSKKLSRSVGMNNFKQQLIKAQPFTTTRSYKM